MLHDIHTLLDRIFVRNRNQHRRSTWWKALHGFRKQMALLLADLQDKQVREVERRRKVEARLRAWDAKGEVHAWYFQFSQLVAVGPFSMLGLVLVASVARVCRITGITAVYEQIASAEVKSVLDASNELALAGKYGAVLGEAEGCDEGVVIARENEDE
ncbi:RNase MRP subunit [Exserohilum turcicum]